MNKKIGIIGAGFVGNSLYEGFKNKFDILIYDIDESKRNIESIEELICKVKTVFVCVPTPMKLKTGECDTSIVESVLKELNKNETKINAIIKSTTPPDKIEKFEKEFSHLNLIANPEFLTEVNAVKDFLEQDRIILGGKKLKAVSKIYKKVFPNVPIYKTDIKTAMMMKYMTNCFLATKVSFANEMYQICQKLDIKYNEVKDLVLLDKRIGKTHLNCPGLNNKFGWGGSCFPKDLNSLMFLEKENDIDTKVLKGAWEKNIEVRPEKDWERLKGRAVSKNGDFKSRKK